MSSDKWKMASVPLHIAIDAHSVGARLAGTESYAINLIESLAQIDSFNRYTLYVTKREAVDRFNGRWTNLSVRLTMPHTPLLPIRLTLSAAPRPNPLAVTHGPLT